jgi:hypothetical protein
VSWVRYHDTSLLAVGKFVYIGDDRFRVIHEPNSAEWYLAIKSVTYADQGVYECQVNSKRGGGENRKQQFTLTVVGKLNKQTKTFAWRTMDREGEYVNFSCVALTRTPFLRKSKILKCMLLGGNEG